MLASITPLGERGRHSRWTTTLMFYLAGCTLGGAAAGTLAALLGGLLLSGSSIHVRLGLVAATAAAGVGWEIARTGVPGPRRQVDERWLGRYRGWVYGFGFGTQLGTGLVTVVVTSAVYASLAAAFASGRLDAGLAIGATSGALRGATLLSGGRIVTPERLMVFHARFRALERSVRAVALGAQLALVAAALLAAVV
jgi:hypothetical protein